MCQTVTKQGVVMDTIDVRGLPEDEANLIQKLVDLLREKEPLMESETMKKKSKFFQMVREMQQQAEGLNPEDFDKAIAEAIEFASFPLGVKGKVIREEIYDYIR